MTVSKTSMCNQALSHLAVDAKIDDIDTDTSPEALACLEFYDEVLDATFEAFEWPFATDHGNLNLVSDDYSINPNYQYAYRMPVLAAQFRGILSGVNPDTLNTIVRTALGRDSQGVLIFTNKADAIGEWTRRETDPTRYPKNFVLAFTLHLASFIGKKLTGGDPYKLTERAEQRYERMLSKAQSSSSKQEQPVARPESEFTAGR